MDIDENRLNILGNLAKRQLKAGNFSGTVTMTTNLNQALDGAALVFTQVRVGKLPARVLDEKIPLKYGCLGQETTGAGGFMKALRTVPVIMDIATKMKQLSEKDAWLINFTNPSGIIAEALLNHTDTNTVGLCNCAVNMVKAVADTIGTTAFDYEYVGLNHLSWITSVIKHNEKDNIVTTLTSKAGASYKNIPDIDYDPALLMAVPYIPTSYLSYYYMREPQIQMCLEAEKTRGEICMELEKQLLTQYSNPNLHVKPEELNERGGALYSTAALSVADAIINNKKELHVVAAKNNGAVPFMDDNDVVEVLCELSAAGAAPQAIKEYNGYIIATMRAVKAYEKLTVSAALTGCRDTALAALLAHPLVGDFSKAKPMLDEMITANKEYLPQF